MNWRTSGQFHHIRFSSGIRLRIIGTGGNGVEPTLCLINQKKQQYWFNCGEGTTRNMTVVSQRLGKPVAFFTQASWNKMGGLPSLYFKYKDVSENKYNFECMSPLKNQAVLQQILSRICGKKAFKYISEYQDESFSIFSVELGEDKSLVAYSCKLHDKDQIDFRKALSLGVATGSGALKDLRSGNSFVTSSGKLIQPADVISTLQGGTFIIMECPREEYVNSICDNEQLQPDWFKSRCEKLNFIVHITPVEVLELESYCKWMSSFGPEVHHVLLHSSVGPAESTLQSLMEFYMGFHVMNPELFHLPYIDNPSYCSIKQLALYKFLAKEQVTIGSTGLQIDINYGKKCIANFSNTLPPLQTSLELAYKKVKQHCDSYIKQYHKTLPANCVKNVNTSLKPLHPQMQLSSLNDAIVTFLGTSGTFSSYLRGEAAIVVQTKHSGNIILDCGEEATSQLKKCFGEKKAKEVLINLHTIFISHMHLDHWGGLIELLQERQRAGKGIDTCPVNIIAPSDIFGILQIYSSLCDFEYVAISSKAEGFSMDQKGLLLKTFSVSHVRNSYGISLLLNDDLKIVYSGDTRPCLNMIKEGKDASLLIHDATFCDDHKVRDLIMKRHSFYSEAVKIAKECNANFTVLTHFSNKETLYPLTEKNKPSLMAAVDFMSLRLSDIKKHRLDSAEAADVYKSIHRLMKEEQDDVYFKMPTYN